jgi:RNA polymerase sigma-70 factor (TIGR02954 family)
MEDLVVKARNGDDQAFFELISLNKDRLYGTAMQYLRDELKALEAVQEVTCRAFLKLHKLKYPKYFSTWLVRIMINYCLDELRRTKLVIPLDNLVLTCEDNIEKQETCMDLKYYVGRLKSKYRDVLILRYYEDMSIADISVIMGKPEGTVKIWISRGLKQMRSLLKGSENYDFK